MLDSAQLFGFVAAVAVLVIVPGPNTILILTHSLGGGRPAGGSLGPSQAYLRAVLTNVLNPKVAVFFLALLPQFVRPERGRLVLQFLVLGLIVSAVGFCFGAILAVSAGTLSGWLSQAVVAKWQ